MKRFMLLLSISLTGIISWAQTSTDSPYLSVTDTLPSDSSSYLLKEVVIQTSPVKRKADRFVLSVPSAVNKDGVELLQQAPGVWLSDERISINGSSGTKVFVDNREIKLTGDFLMAYLRSLKSENISRIEVLPMAGADKDANAQGGAIHIYMRRRTDRGVQGSLSATTSFASSLQSYQPGGNLNVHSGKWDVYASASAILTPQNKGEMNAVRQYLTEEKDFSSRTLMKQPSRYGTFRAGAFYTIDTLNKVGVEMEYIRRSYIWHSQSLSFLSAGQIELESNGVYREKEAYDMYSVTANYVHQLDNRGSVLKLVADYVSKDLEGNNRYRISNYKDTVYRSRSQATYQIATADFSWRQQLQKKSFLQAGVKYTYTGMKDDACYEGLEPDESWKRNEAYGYELDYHENIGAAYATYSLDGKKGGIHIGLRGEYTQTSNRTDHQTRKYWDWFPHIDASYYFDELHKWMLIGQYARYIERPTFAALNPNRIQTSDYSYVIGNPALRPTYINKFSATLVYNYRYTLTIGGTLHHDLIREFGKEDGTDPDVSYIIYENHNRENHWFVAISAPWQPTTWLNLTANIIGVKQDIRMFKEDRYVSHFLYFGNANATFYLPSDYSLEGQYSGASRLYSGNSRIEPFHTFNFRLRKKWNDGRLVATLGVDNLFNRRNVYVSDLPSYSSESRYQLASVGRQLKLTFTWNFNQGKKTKRVTIEKQSSGERDRFKGK